jgi:uncharacterized protein YfaS (alpha-2-macroglobulin family)
MQMKKLGLLVTVLLLIITAVIAQQSDFAPIKSQAEKFYAEGSYARAHELYEKAKGMKLSAAESRWVDFRLADTSWRSQAATETSDPTVFEQAQKKLQALLETEKPDEITAEINESMGDFFWLRRDARNWGGAWPYYEKALDWWAGSDQIDLARGRYLKIVKKVAQPPSPEPYYYYGYYGNYVPIEVLDNALKISTTATDRSHFHYLIAMTLRSQGDPQDRASEEFEEAIKAGKTSDWYDDAIFNYAQLLEQKSEFERALKIYRRITTEFTKGETRYYDQAVQQIKTITEPSLDLRVANLFLPTSEVQYFMSWRNLQTIQLALYRIDLIQDVNFTQNETWIQNLVLSGKKPLKSWTKQAETERDYKPHQETLKLDSKLDLGAYILLASSGSVQSKDLVLVTDATLVTKTKGNQILIYFADAQNGSPLANASYKVWQNFYNGSSYQWRQQTGKTGPDGISITKFPEAQQTNQFFVTASTGARQAFSAANSYSYAPEVLPWKIYAFTDRPAYRPEEDVQWKFIARRYDGSVYSTPSNQLVEYQITDPQGAKVKDGKAKLNAFGSAFDKLSLTEAMPLGEYRITFYDEGRHNSIGGATLFRLEEYKLPEFKVAIETPEENGKKKTYLLGENVEVNIQADYYFGGPVANANVEVLVYQNPFYNWWYPEHPYRWYYEDIYQNPYRYNYGNGQIVHRDTLKTDASGKASLHFDTPRNSQQDFEYRIEARVTDASRREIQASDSVRVTRQRYYVYPRPEHCIYQPAEKVTVNFKTLDANQQSVQAEGQVKVTRDFWYEIWIDPNGKEVKVLSGDPRPQKEGWKLKFQGYQHDDISTQTVKTDANGEAAFNFSPQSTGYYRIAWNSGDKKNPIQAETTVWVTTTTTNELGYRHGGVEIIVDKDTFHAGEKAPVMLNVPTNDRYVLFAIEGEDLYSYQLVHMTGTVKLMEIDIQEKHVPNIFLSAALVNDYQVFLDTKEVVVPPVEQFLDVSVKSDRNEYQPQEEGTLTVTARDYKGKPISAEIALALTDESVTYIQQDYAGDPRQFFFGTKRQHLIQTQSMYQQKYYPTEVQDRERQKNKDIVYRDGGEVDELKSLGYVSEGVAGGKVGGLDARKSADKEEMAVVAESALVQIAAAPPPAAPKPSTPGEPAVQVRSDFRSTAFWQPDIVTDKNGNAVVKIKYPDSLTTWNAVARVSTSSSQFGTASGKTRTKKPLIVRLQAPRFFVAGDSVTLSANINNNTDEPMNVSADLKVEGLQITGGNSSIIVPANSEKRLDWNANVTNPGPAKITLTARAAKYSDAMEKTYVIYDHGIEKFLARSGKVRSDEVTVKLALPAQRRSTELMVQVTPSMAVTMLDALPYLIDYPYGCTEQTMSRFLPAVITAKTLKELGLPSDRIFQFGGIEKATADKTHPNGRKSLQQLPAMMKAGLSRLYDFQHSDGGWGWWKDGESDHFMTAYVIWGFSLAKQAGIEIHSDSFERGVTFLKQEIVEEEENFDMQAWMLHALSASGSKSELEAKAFANLWKNRDRLNAYTRALLALSAAGLGHNEEAQVLVRNLENGVKVDSAPDKSILIGGTSDESAIGNAHWGEDGIYWRWSDGGVEATAFALKALLTIDPQNKLIEPVTNWLIKNRRGAQWNSTRDTAIVVLALNDYLRKSGELKTALDYELLVNGTSIAKQKIAPADVFDAPSQFRIESALIRDQNEIVIRRTSGSGPIYFSTQAKFFSMEEPVTAAGNEIFVRRQYFKLVGKPTLLKGYVYDRQLLTDLGSVKSGERIEAVIQIEAKNNYEYLIFEDLKPAGLEAVAIRSGESLYAQELKAGKAGASSASPLPQSDLYTGQTRWVYQELRDRKVALFIDKLPEGVWEIRYDLRAEVPGKFHALPLIGYAMYVPEIRANSEEIRITVVD